MAGIPLTRAARILALSRQQQQLVPDYRVRLAPELTSTPKKNPSKRRLFKENVRDQVMNKITV